MGEPDPFASGINAFTNNAFATLFSDVPVGSMVDPNASLLNTDLVPTTSPQQAAQKSNSQIPGWVWVALGGSLLIVLTLNR